MKWLVAVSLGVLLGTCLASCKSQAECILRMSNNCNKKALEDVTKIFDFCYIHPLMAKCVRDGLEECAVDFVSEGDKVVDHLQEVCKKGTDLNNEYKKYEECVTKTLVFTTYNCMKDVYTVIEDMTNPSKNDIFNYQKEMCKRSEEVMECAYNNMRETCGAEAEAFLRTIIKPAYTLQKKTCKVLLDTLYFLPNYFLL